MIKMCNNLYGYGSVGRGLGSRLLNARLIQKAGASPRPTNISFEALKNDFIRDIDSK